jgi:hypothetical protein
MGLVDGCHKSGGRMLAVLFAMCGDVFGCAGRAVAMPSPTSASKMPADKAIKMRRLKNPPSPTSLRIKLRRFERLLEKCSRIGGRAGAAREAGFFFMRQFVIIWLGSRYLRARVEASVLVVAWVSE